MRAFPHIFGSTPRIYRGIFATVWDSVSTYALTVVGDGVDRHLSIEPDLDDESAEPVRYASGQKLLEEPNHEGLDESFIQLVVMGRCGFDPSAIRQSGWEWRELIPLTEAETRVPRAQASAVPESVESSEPAPPAAAAQSERRGAMARLKGLFGR